MRWNNFNMGHAHDSESNWMETNIRNGSTSERLMFAVKSNENKNWPTKYRNRIKRLWHRFINVRTIFRLNLNYLKRRSKSRIPEFVTHNFTQNYEKKNQLWFDSITFHPIWCMTVQFFPLSPLLGNTICDTFISIGDTLLIIHYYCLTMSCFFRDGERESTWKWASILRNKHFGNGFASD